MSAVDKVITRSIAAAHSKRIEQQRVSLGENAHRDYQRNQNRELLLQAGHKVFKEQDLDEIIASPSLKEKASLAVQAGATGIVAGGGGRHWFRGKIQ